MIRRGMILTLTATIGTLAGAAWLWLPSPPLGIPGEWVWPRIEYEGGHPWSWLVSAICAIGYLLVVQLVAWRLERSDRGTSSPIVKKLRRTGGICAVMAAALGWWGGLLSSIPYPYGLSRAPHVIYHPRTSGYFWEARYDTSDARTFLAGYEEMLQEREDPQRYLHIGTHPPGMILMHRGILAAVDASPGLVRALERSMPDSIRRSMRELVLFANLSGSVFDARDAAALWLATLITFAAAALTIAPLTWLLIREGLFTAQALRWASLWAFVPAVCVFLPKCDVLLPPVTLLLGWMWFTAVARRSWWRAAVAGLLAFAGLFLSLAMLPVAAWLGLTTILSLWKTSRRVAAVDLPAMESLEQQAAFDRPTLRWVFRLIAVAAVGFVIPIVVLFAVFRLNMLHVWQLNFANHAEFYAHSSRTYAAWLVANVLELALAAGPPLAVMAAAGGLSAVRAFFRGATNHGAPVIAAMLVLGLLWISGKNMGEAARLWIPFLPWMILAAGRSFRVSFDDLSANTSSPRRWLLIAGLQAVAAILTSTRIDGFGFSELP